MPTVLLPSSSFAASSFSSGPCLIRHAHWDFQHHSRQRKQPGSCAVRHTHWDFQYHTCQRKQPGRCAVCRVLCTPGSIARQTAHSVSSANLGVRPLLCFSFSFGALSWILHHRIVATSRLLSDTLVCSEDGRALATWEDVTDASCAR